MTLSSALKSAFGSKDKTRGASYFRNGRVSNLRFRDGQLLADVVGTYRSYEVFIDLEAPDENGGLFCTCPRYAGGDPCKHIWAVLLTYESDYQDRFRRPKRTLTTMPNPEVLASPAEEKASKSKPPEWQQLFASVKSSVGMQIAERGSIFQGASELRSEIYYCVDAGSSYSSYEPEQLELTVLKRSQNKTGQWGKLKAFNLSHHNISELSDPTDQEIASLLLGSERQYGSLHSYQTPRTSFSKFTIDPSWSADFCELLSHSGRVYWSLDRSLDLDDFQQIESIDFNLPATVCISIAETSNSRDAATMSVSLQIDGLSCDDRVLRIADNGILLLTDRLTRVENKTAIELWKKFHYSDAITIEKSERKSFLKQLTTLPGIPHVDLPASWQVDSGEQISPIGVLHLDRSKWKDNDLFGTISFRYGETELRSTKTDDVAVAYDEVQNCWIKRDPEAEIELLADVFRFPITDTSDDRYSEHDFRIHKKHLVRIVDELGMQGWRIQLHGKPVKQSGQFSFSVETGLDWFDLAANVTFDGETIPLPGLLQAISRKDDFIALADGSSGRIPQEVLEKFTRIANFGQVEGDKIRFRPTQAMLLDAMLDSQKVDFDKGFKGFRKKLHNFTGIKPKSPPRSFQGTLRKYQTEGLGWLHFLRDFGFGGCLADDMGLGKTIQVLSLLESRRTRRLKSAKVASDGDKITKGPKNKREKLPAIVVAAEMQKRKPSIVVVPKSLIFNWIEEAAVFTPRLKVLNYTGTDRRSRAAALQEDGFDVLITTYGTMTRDIGEISQIDFDYAILDESQAIKNSKALCAKASRLLRADHRLAMTGTPIENHLGELWSLFEFLNPGMLGGSTNFATLTNQKKSNEEEREQTIKALASAIKPFMLRRTKEQVLTDLPPKTEQTLYCDMLPAQKKAYDEVKEYYRVKLAKKVETDGIGRSKIQVLEALLRLRQVACDPRLLDDSAKPGAKLALLREQIRELISEGHKVLIFSQFTSLLKLVQQQFNDDGICHEYLDGKTSNRAARVERFQNDESVLAFLISIKAGGSGLNLTAADYVFLLDPWWNPAVEAQAIDRVHRIGQTNPVIAYRMICRDTVEEKILDLQKSKLNLASKIVRADDSLIRSLTAEDLRALFE